MIAYSFDGLQLREANAGDLALAQAWTTADPDHAGRVPPEFWIANGWLLSDAAGAIFFFKGIRLGLGRALEIHVQFPPPPVRCSSEYKLQFHTRLSSALVAGMAWLERNAQDVDELRFESKSRPLIRFCENRLGFVNRDGQLSKRLTVAIGG